MKIFLALVFFLFAYTAYAGETSNPVYTFGSYDNALIKKGAVVKLGPIPASQVPPQLPKSFLEKDGSYGGGEAYKTISESCRALAKKIASGELPLLKNWHIYLLKARWSVDTYQLHANDFRVNHPVIVLKEVKSTC